jgi:hypothetical protein
MEYKTTRGLALTQGVKALVYGKADSGKTTAIETFRKPIIVSAESGLLPLAHKDFPYFTVNTIEGITSLSQWLRTPANYLGIFEVMCIDSLTEIAEVVLADELAKHKDGRKAYGAMQDAVMELIRTIRDCYGIHVYATAWQADTLDAVTGLHKSTPYFPSTKLPTVLPHFFDEILHLSRWLIDVVDDNGNTVKRPQFFVQTESDTNILARDRSRCLGMYEPANMQAIFDKIVAGEQLR